eukprot:TRINITY_DN4766_c0_g1_i1.p1 TRINITY_DN4766_c0_g1~~TRINITY_DN4766_c0_g1_i1.p1  ORF type:complete len:674 (-),score=142.20 TRINITY_DN4766_c0_g1_i1:59-2059(-)
MGDGYGYDNSGFPDIWESINGSISTYQTQDVDYQDQSFLSVVNQNGTQTQDSGIAMDFTMNYNNNNNNGINQMNHNNTMRHDTLISSGVFDHISTLPQENMIHNNNVNYNINNNNNNIHQGTILQQDNLMNPNLFNNNHNTLLSQTTAIPNMFNNNMNNNINNNNQNMNLPGTQGLNGILVPQLKPEVKAEFPLWGAAQQILDKIQNDSRAVDEEVAKLRNQIIHFYSNVNLEGYHALDRQIRQLRTIVRDSKSQLDDLINSQALSVSQYSSFEPRQMSLNMQDRQLTIYSAELSVFANGQNPLSSAPVEDQYALVLEDKPPPEVVFKDRPFSRLFKVKLLTPTYFPFRKGSVLSQCQATALLEPEKQKKVSNKGSNSTNITHDIQAMDKDKLSASFTPLFGQGTRKNATMVKFNLTVAFEGTKPVRLVSEESNPFVVITNESQWGEAQGILCKRDIFRGGEEATWCRFTNIFNMHFVNSTRQSLNSNEEFRPLSQADFNYLHSKWFEDRINVSIRAFDKFWGWFKHTLHLLRYQKKMLGGLWRSGLLYGFITKEMVNDALRDQQDGTFLIRFSETKEGSFAVAYKHENSIKHYLVKPDEKKTLPDFLNETPFFKNFLKLEIDEAGSGRFSLKDKSEALAAFVVHHPKGVTQAPEDKTYSELPMKY